MSKEKHKTKLILPNICITTDFNRDIHNLEKQYIRIVSDLKTLNPKRTIDEILSEINLPKTKYYSIKARIKQEIDKTFIKIPV